MNAGGTLDKEDINLDGKIDLFDLGAIFREPCDPEKVRRQDSKEKKGRNGAEVI